MKKTWIKTFIKYFDFNLNKKVDWWEVIILLVLLGLIEVVFGILSNYIYDKL